MDFEWDDAKAESNERKHGVAFSEALTVFADPLSVTGYDPRHADVEDRFLTMGVSVDGRLLVVCRTLTAVTWFASSAPVKQPGESERTIRDGDFPDDPEPADDLQPEYDFRSLQGVVRGKYAADYRERLRMVRLAQTYRRRSRTRRPSTTPYALLELAAGWSFS